MKVIGTGHVHLYEEAADECPHVPDDEPLWQESWALFVWDPKQGVFVFLRLGQEPNRGTGYTSVWINLWTPEYLFKHTDDSIPIKPGDSQEKSFSAGGGLLRYDYDGEHDWTAKSQDVTLEVTMRNSHPGFGFWPGGANSMASEVGKEHIEASGQATGKVTIKGKSYQFAGTAWRDHSWGKRNWRGFRVHRYYAAMFENDFSIFCVTIVLANGNITRIGTIMRGNTVEATSAFDIVAYIGEDGVSNCGGQVKLQLDGKTEILNFEPFSKGVVSVHQECTISNSLCKVTMGDKVGVGNSESSNNAQGGLGRPAVFPSSKGVLDNGLYPLST